jgi:hypothetical protein
MSIIKNSRRTAAPIVWSYFDPEALATHTFSQREREHVGVFF